MHESTEILLICILSTPSRFKSTNVLIFQLFYLMMIKCDADGDILVITCSLAFHW